MIGSAVGYVGFKSYGYVTYFVLTSSPLLVISNTPQWKQAKLMCPAITTKRPLLSTLTVRSASQTTLGSVLTTEKTFHLLSNPVITRFPARMPTIWSTTILVTNLTFSATPSVHNMNKQLVSTLVSRMLPNNLLVAQPLTGTQLTKPRFKLPLKRNPTRADPQCGVFPERHTPQAAATSNPSTIIHMVPMEATLVTFFPMMLPSKVTRLTTWLWAQLKWLPIFLATMVSSLRATLTRKHLNSPSSKVRTATPSLSKISSRTTLWNCQATLVTSPWAPSTTEVCQDPTASTLMARASSDQFP